MRISNAYTYLPFLKHEMPLGSVFTLLSRRLPKTRKHNQQTRPELVLVSCVPCLVSFPLASRAGSRRDHRRSCRHVMHDDRAGPDLRTAPNV